MMKGIKRMLNMIAFSRLRLEEEDWKEASKMIAEVLRSQDLREGRAAFLEKRPPRFVGR